MMRWFAILVLSLVLAGSSRAAGPDDQYLDIYNEILQADSLRQLGHSKAAAEKYIEAQSALKRIKDEHPDWKPDIVGFRLDYLSEQIHALTPAQPATNAPAPQAAAPVQPATEAAGLQEQIRSLTAANAQLENKLKEALSVQSAAASPGELAKAQEKIILLEKENALLSVAVAQAKAATTPSSTPANADKDKTARQLADLKAELAARTKDLADAEAHRDPSVIALQAQLAEAQRQRDELKTKLAATPGATKAAASAEAEQLRARLAVLEAKAVPYTPEELAMMKQNPRPEPALALAPLPAQGPAAPAESRHVVHSMKDLPPGAGALMTEAARAGMAGDHAKAAEKYLEILHQDPDNVFVLAHLATSQFALGQMDDCEKTVAHALALDPQDSVSLYFLGRLRLRQEKLDEALDALSLSAKYSPTNADAHYSRIQYSLGRALEEKGLRYAAETAFRKALVSEPENGDAHYSLAVVYASEKPPSLELARWHYKRAVDLGHEKNLDLEKLLALAP